MTAHATESATAPQAAAPAGHAVAEKAATAAPSTFDVKVGEFIHRHREATDKPVGHLAYQVVRNLAAAVPYGIATVATWMGFEKIAAKTAKAPAGSFGNNIHQLAKSPVRDIAMIAAGFTLYRGTLRFVRYTKERLFNPEHTREQTIAEVQHFGKHAWETTKEIAPAEINSTPYGAIALGLGRRYLEGIKDYRERNAADTIPAGTLGSPQNGHQRMLHFMRDGKFSPHLVGTAAGAAAGRTPFKEFMHKVMGRGSKPLAEAGVFILSFLSFFELSDRLFKDVQVRRGMWADPNSLLRQQPEEREALKAREKETGLDRDPDYLKTKHVEQPKTFGTPDPNLLRLGFVRVLPTVLGIGAYTFTKRASYAAMGHFTAKANAAGKTSFAKAATVEGLATATFFVMTTAADTFEMLWKKYFEPKKTVTLDSYQTAKFAELDEKLRTKEAAQGRVA